MSQSPTFAEEKKLLKLGYQFIAGVDEVGRGPLAGPVVASAVILPLEDNHSWISQVRDSKKLTSKKREFLSSCIRREAVAVGIGVVPPETIDKQGIVGATRLAMQFAIEKLPLTPDFLLIDALALPEIKTPQKGIIRGDNLSFSIAAASIVAKVHRDQLMMDYDSLYPTYGFARNKGYPTPQHLAMLRRSGCCPIHRHSFAPVREVEIREKDV